jgi:hypothetical protein
MRLSVPCQLEIAFKGFEGTREPPVLRIGSLGVWLVWAAWEIE